MKFFRRRSLHLAAGAAVLTAISRMARAQGYPARPVRVDQPFEHTAVMIDAGAIRVMRYRS